MQGMPRQDDVTWQGAIRRKEFPVSSGTEARQPAEGYLGTEGVWTRGEAFLS
jgi:hypothetical protein